MAMCESLHHTSPLPSPWAKPRITPTYQCHLTATSLTLLGQGSGILQAILMFLWIWGGVSQDMKSLLIIVPVIITARQEITSAMIDP